MRVLMIEDDRRTASFVGRGLREAGFTVVHAADGEDGQFQAVNETFDAIVLDLMLPKIDGLTVLKSVRGAGVKTPVLILSAKGSVDEKVTGLQCGGDDYLAKPFAFAELLWRLHALIRRSEGQPGGTRLGAGDLEIDLLTREVQRAGRRIELQPREYALLEYLVRNAGRIVTKTMLIEHVWDYNFDPGTNIVESRMSRLRSKVDGPGERPLIRTIRGAGYMLKP